MVWFYLLLLDFSFYKFSFGCYFFFWRVVLCRGWLVFYFFFLLCMRFLMENLVFLGFIVKFLIIKGEDIDKIFYFIRYFSICFFFCG